MAITAEEYFKKVGNTKEVTLPSGSKFKIRKIQARELVGQPMPFSSKEDLKGIDTEKQQEIWSRMTPEEQKKQTEFCDFMILRAVIEPEINENNINDIPDEDYNKLLEYVSDFSFGRVKDVSPLSETK